MVPTSELKRGALRLMDVDNRLIIPIQTEVRVLVTGGDVPLDLVFYRVYSNLPEISSLFFSKTKQF